MRQPIDVTWVRLPNVDWEIVKNYTEFVKLITERGVPDIVSFDHDLADEHYLQIINKNPVQFNYDQCKEKTGYDCAKFLVQYCMDNNIPFPEFYIHTQNPIGALNIFSYISSYQKSK